MRQTGGKEVANIDSKRHPTQDNNHISMKKTIETRLQTNTTNYNAKKNCLERHDSKLSNILKGHKLLSENVTYNTYNNKLSQEENMLINKTNFQMWATNS